MWIHTHTQIERSLLEMATRDTPIHTHTHTHTQPAHPPAHPPAQPPHTQKNTPHTQARSSTSQAVPALFPTATFGEESCPARQSAPTLLEIATPVDEESGHCGTARHTVELLVDNMTCGKCVG